MVTQSDPRVSNACRFSGENLQGHGQIANKYVYPIAEIFKTNSEDKNRPQYAG